MRWGARVSECQSLEAEVERRKSKESGKTEVESRRREKTEKWETAI